MNKNANPDLPYSRHHKRVCKICGKNLVSRQQTLSNLCKECRQKTYNTERHCPRCMTTKPASEFTPTSSYCKKCLSIYTNSQFVKTKKRAVEYKGGKCIKCGYDKCLASLEFHHRNPKEKDFIISRNKSSFEKIKNELDKCDLVCSNCHGEIHYNPQELLPIPKDAYSSISYQSREEKPCEFCGKPTYNNHFCSYDCDKKSRRKVTRPSQEQLQLDISTMSWVAIGKKYSVSDNAVRKWAKAYKLI